jgi:hypothetical protein
MDDMPPLPEPQARLCDSLGGLALFNDDQMHAYAVAYAAAQGAQERERVNPKTKQEYAWECNECGAQEYTMCVSEDDVNRLGCGNCGGDEWHKAAAIRGAK